MERLRLLRKQHNLTQQKLANILDITQQSIHKYEHDLTSPDLKTLKNMAVYFNTSVDYLLEVTDIPHKIEPVTETMLNDMELELVEGYRKITPFQKDLVQNVIREFVNGKS
uniref:helix-turn-helix domain-containing protein n=1 Tax=Agathobacter sp. TaxID=2021311 RepID=UPI0040572451